jgi:predicted enzyme related to lactoylglutathione lyase
MHLQRRRLLQVLSFGFGSGLILKGSELCVGQSTQKENTSASETPVFHQLSGATTMEKVTGIGGLFFRAHDPEALARWYQQHLGVTPTPTSYDAPVWKQEAGTTVFAPFSETSKYFGDANKVWMVNFRVRDLDKMAAQLKAAGIEVEIDPQTYPNGRFARLHDPEGNPIELWQPQKLGASH